MTRNPGPTLLATTLTLALAGASAAFAADPLADFATGGYASAVRTMDMMHSIDTDKDGRVSVEEWDAFQARSFATLDSDHDGYVEEKELMSPNDEGFRFATAAYARGLRSDEMFRKMDSNGDGRVSKEEFLTWQRKVFSMLGHGKTQLTPAEFLHVGPG